MKVSRRQVLQTSAALATSLGFDLRPAQGAARELKISRTNTDAQRVRNRRLISNCRLVNIFYGPDKMEGQIGRLPGNWSRSKRPGAIWRCVEGSKTRCAAAE